MVSTETINLPDRIRQQSIKRYTGYGNRLNRLGFAKRPSRAISTVQYY